MTLFIACLLIYQFNMPWWLYAVACGLWLLRNKVVYGAFEGEFQMVKDRLPSSVVRDLQ
jgi:hypothetical protein